MCGTGVMDLTNLLDLASSLPVEHRLQAKRCHPCLSCAAASTCSQFIPLSCISLSRFCLHVFLGLPLLRCPSGFQYKDCFGIYVSSLRRVWSNHFHFLLFGWVDVGSCLVLFQYRLMPLPLQESQWMQKRWIPVGFCWFLGLSPRYSGCKRDEMVRPRLPP